MRPFFIDVSKNEDIRKRCLEGEDVFGDDIQRTTRKPNPDSWIYVDQLAAEPILNGSETGSN